VGGVGGGAGEAQHKASETVLRDVRVIAVDQKLDSKGNEALVAHTATLEVTPKQSEMIAVASEMGKLSLSLRSLAAPPGEKPRAGPDAVEEPGTFTLDSEVSQLLRKPGNSGADGVTVLRGNSKSG
jgi:pilus assembly protein CpaB